MDGQETETFLSQGLVAGGGWVVEGITELPGGNLGYQLS